MNSQRYDIYALIHKGLRSCLTETLLAVGRMDLQSREAIHAALDQLRSLLELCSGHLQHENEFIHPAMEAREPGVAADMYGHHEQHVAMIDELRSLADEVEACDTGPGTAAAARLYRRLAVFVADNLAHMHEEETANNAVLWRHYSDSEIQEIEGRLVQSISPGELERIMRWMLTAMNHQERRGFLNEMRVAAPQPAFEGVLHIARAHLPAPEWDKLALALAS